MALICSQELGYYKIGVLAIWTPIVGLGRRKSLPFLTVYDFISRIRPGSNFHQIRLTPSLLSLCHKIIPLYGPGGIGLGACFDDVYEMNPRMFKPLPI
jgi:hypothetical protein